MNLIIKIIILFLLLSLKSISAQQSNSMLEIESKLSLQSKYLVIELYTDWCGVCAIQDKKIQKNKELVSLLDNEFYYVRFNSESKESFVFKGHNFENKDNKIHDFVKAVSADSNVFPVWIIMNPELEIIFQHYGLLAAEKLETILLEIKSLEY